MNIQLITPVHPVQWSGNRVTAERWTRILRDLGHQVGVKNSYDRSPCDLMIALHARRSARFVLDLHRQQPDTPIIVCLTGTDLYRDIHTHRSAQRCLELADRLIVLHPRGSADLPRHLRQKTRVILQSLKQLPRTENHSKGTFDVCVVANLRPVKDPFRTAMAARMLPKSSKLRVIHIGGPLSDGMAERAHAEMKRNHRYQWLGEKSWGQTLRIMSRCRTLVLTSKMEGGANVISEALVVSAPVISSEIPGSIGILGKDYPGFFPPRDTRALATLLNRLESEPGFIDRLQSICQSIAPMFEPRRERKSWKNLFEEMGLS